MENQENTSSNSVILNYGIILGIASVLFAVIIYAMGMHLEQDWKTSAISLLITTAVIVLALKKFKQVNSNSLKFGQGLKIAARSATPSGLGSAYSSPYRTPIAEPSTPAPDRT